MASEASPQTPSNFRAKGPTYIATIAIGHGLKHWYIAAFSVFIPLIKDEYELTAAGVTAIGLMRQFFGGAPNFFVGYVSDRLRGHWHLLLPASFLGSALAMLIAGQMPWVWPLVFFAALGGLSAAFWHPPAISMLSTRFPRRRGMAIAFHGSGSGSGEALGPLVVGFVLVAWLADDWRLYTLLSFFPAIAITFVLYWLLVGAGKDESEAPTHREARLMDTIGLLKYRAFQSLAFTNFSRSFAHFGLLTFMPVYLADDLGMDSFGVGFHVSLLTLIGVVVGPVYGYFSDRTSRRTPIVLALVAIAAGTLVAGIVGEGILFTLALAFTGVFLWSMQDVTNATAMDAAPAGLQGSTVALMFLSSLAGATFSQIVMGAVAGTLGYGYIFYLAAAVAAPSALVLAVAPLNRPGEQATAD